MSDVREDLVVVLCSACAQPWHRDYNDFEFMEDHQFERFGKLCLRCRLPDHGEGHFSRKMTASDLQSTDLCLTLMPDIVDIIAGYSAQPRKLQEWTAPALTTNAQIRVDPRDKPPSLMSILGVEDAFHEAELGDTISVCFDTRWFKSPRCRCTEVVCVCTCLRRQLINICGIMGIEHEDYKYLVEAELFNPCEGGLHIVAQMFNGCAEPEPEMTATEEPCGVCVDCRI